MKKVIKYGLLLLIIVIASQEAYAQKDRNRGIIWSSLVGLEYQIKAGINIGGTSPLPLPAEIRKIDSYNPDLGLSLGTEITKWFGGHQKFGAIIGLTLDTRTMRTDATVKNYGMELIQEGQKVSGRWTGGVKTKFRSSYLTFPVLFGYKVSKRVNLKVGPYFSYLISKNFSGYVHDGYLREGDPTGIKVEYTDGKTAPYDFSDELSPFQWGARLGVDWRAFKHLNVFSDLSWGLNDVFKRSFDTITFKMYAIYLNTGFAYHF